ncbi:MAG: hypothetical protein HZA53_18090 [Planctomycetes bacterium]|nr:hypothetical protein [Planctomycetota bacterium]
MRRVLFSIAVLIVLWFGGRAIVRSFASDATKIRWAVESMIDGFDRTRTDDVLEGLAPEFLDETYGADRAMVRSACAYLFFQAKDPTTKGFLYSAECEPSGIVVTEDRGGGPSRAEAQLDTRFFEKKGDERKLVWRIDVRAQFVERDGEWRILRSETRTVEGERLR